MRWGTAILVALLAAACGGSSLQPASSTTLSVVAAENFWGSLATELGGSKVSVQSVVTDPNADPHEYESSSADARAFADARLVILNGAGYDTWGQKLLDANPSAGRQVLNIADLLGKKNGGNPHFWYSPAYVNHVADEITIDPEPSSLDADVIGLDGQDLLQQRRALRQVVAILHQCTHGDWHRKADQLTFAFLHLWRSVYLRRVVRTSIPRRDPNDPLT